MTIQNCPKLLKIAFGWRLVLALGAAPARLVAVAFLFESHSYPQSCQTPLAEWPSDEATKWPNDFVMMSCFSALFKVFSPRNLYCTLALASWSDCEQRCWHCEDAAPVCPGDCHEFPLNVGPARGKRERSTPSPQNSVPRVVGLDGIWFGVVSVSTSSANCSYSRYSEKMVNDKYQNKHSCISRNLREESFICKAGGREGKREGREGRDLYSSFPIRYLSYSCKIRPTHLVTHPSSSLTPILQNPSLTNTPTLRKFLQTHITKSEPSTI
jgi:hypothetical protein